MNASEETKDAKLSDILKVLEIWNVWDDISALANHQTVKSYLQTCLQSVNKMHCTGGPDPEVRFHSTGCDN